jgi:FkbM family methyltransferase
MALFSPRTLAERVSRGKTLWRRLPLAFGRAPLLVSPDAALQLLKFGERAFDPMLLRLCDEHVQNGNSVWDIGANVGIFSLAAAQRGAEVLAIEPDVFLYSLLRKTRLHRENQSLAFEPLCAAIAAEPGTARLAIASRGRASNFLEEFKGRSQTGGARSTVLVPVLTLDLLLRGHTAPSLIKIDVEGAEEAVLNGATKVLTTIRPTILIEVGQETSENIIMTLKKNNYQLFDYESGQCINNSDNSPSNILAIPM